MKSLLSILFGFLLISAPVMAEDWTNPSYQYGGSTNAPGSTIFRARGHAGDKEHLYTSDILNGVYGYGYDGTNFGTSSRVSIQLQASEAWTTTANGTQILFKVTPVTTTTPVTPMTISGTGVSFTTMTVTGLFGLRTDAAPRTNITPTAIGQMIVNTGASPDQVCISSGTTASTWVKIADFSTACDN